MSSVDAGGRLVSLHEVEFDCGLRSNITNPGAYHRKLPWSKFSGWRASRPKAEGSIDYPSSVPACDFRASGRFGLA